MRTSDPLEILLVHNRWATRNLIEACRALPRDQLHRSFDMGPGSIYATIVHILGALRGWGDLLAGREQRERLETELATGDGEATPDDLLTLLDAIADDFDASARSHPTDELVTGSRGGRTFTFTRGAVATHVTTHGMHHRAQCLNMLRQLGVETLPPSAVVEWTFMADAPVG